MVSCISACHIELPSYFPMRSHGYAQTFVDEIKPLIDLMANSMLFMGRSRMITQRELKARARAEVKAKYDRFNEEFVFVYEFLKARAAAGITQAEYVECIGTTQTATARLESGCGKHSPSLATLQKYAHPSAVVKSCGMSRNPIKQMV